VGPVEGVGIVETMARAPSNEMITEKNENKSNESK
jgi:hypothetical protein